jgi:cell division protein FtsB
MFDKNTAKTAAYLKYNSDYAAREVSLQKLIAMQSSEIATLREENRELRERIDYLESIFPMKNELFSKLTAENRTKIGSKF